MCVGSFFFLRHTKSSKSECVFLSLGVLFFVVYYVYFVVVFPRSFKIVLPVSLPHKPKIDLSHKLLLKYRMYRDNKWLHTCVGPRCNGSSMMDLGHFQVVVFMFAHGLNRSMKAYEPPTIFINQHRTLHEAGQSLRSASQIPKASCLPKDMDINKHQKSKIIRPRNFRNLSNQQQFSKTIQGPYPIKKIRSTQSQKPHVTFHRIFCGVVFGVAFVRIFQDPPPTHLPTTTHQARTDAVLLSVDRGSFEACGGRSEGSMARCGSWRDHPRTKRSNEPSEVSSPGDAMGFTGKYHFTVGFLGVVRITPFSI